MIHHVICHKFQFCNRKYSVKQGYKFSQWRHHVGVTWSDDVIWRHSPQLIFPFPRWVLGIRCDPYRKVLDNFSKMENLSENGKFCQSGKNVSPIETWKYQKFTTLRNNPPTWFKSKSHLSDTSTNQKLVILEFWFVDDQNENRCFHIPGIGW